MVAAVLGFALLQPSLPDRGSEPNWSRDGSKLAFQAEDGLWTVNADKSDPRHIVSDRECYYLRWTPDASRLTFVGTVDKHYEFFSVKPDGTDRRRFLPDNAPKPRLVPVVWSADGKRIAYATNTADGTEKVVIVDPISGAVVSTVPQGDASEPGFSADGKHMLYLSHDAIYVADASG